ncbi:SRPBCC family protein [Deinococcus ruber]|uniref:SRPBCC family protein n=1 Tax=Deinococcus ruber TaxID=1848197 RepID=A0A918FFG5_9DEIO|nr:SRPBCC family protein [Deinococcus ruber]GGR34748.1 hypothetical protein GCM10008957_51040 [Deinococcus ruber]
MPTSFSRTTLETKATPEQAFEDVRDVSAFSSWLSPSLSYRGTTTPSPGRALLGTRYVDHTTIGDMAGEVVEFQVHRRITFSQQPQRLGLALRITYDLEPALTGTKITRVGRITTTGVLALIHPVVVFAIRSENRRTMKRLKDLLELQARHLSSDQPHSSHTDPDAQLPPKTHSG